MSEAVIQTSLKNDTTVLISPDLPASSLSQVKSAPIQLGIMASGSGTNFEAVARAIADGQLNAEIKVLIYNNPQAKVKERAEKYKIPTVLIDHRQYKQRTSLDQEIVAVLKAHGVDWVVMAGWMRIVTEVLLAGYPNRVINIHPSLLPSF
ncbi:MAG: phosphoribosylglycinamide formyltransferase, partial [Waterburya sp.]